MSIKNKYIAFGNSFTMNQTPTPYTSLNARELSKNFKEFIKNQPYSPDHLAVDYEGSGISMLADLMGQWVQQDAFVANRALTESNILMSEDWINLATHLASKGYIAKQVSPARFVLGSLVVEGGVQRLGKRSTLFTGTKNGASYPFSLVKDYVSRSNTYNNVELVQGL